MPRRKPKSFRAAVAAGKSWINRKPVSLASPPWDHGATGPANRAGLMEEAATEIDPETGKERPNPNRVTRVRRILVLEEYASRGAITPRQLAMGLELYAASAGTPERDALAAIGEIAPDRAPGLSIVQMMDARRKFWAMQACLRRILPEAWPAVECVCVLNEPINARLVKRRDFDAAMHSLRVGLDVLADRAPWQPARPEFGDRATAPRITPR